MKATYGSIEVKGGIVEQKPDPFHPQWQGEGLFTAYEVACPDCGRAARMPVPPFTFTREPLSIGPASVKLPCGWHGYLTAGIWKRSSDSKCGESRAMMEERKTANMAHLAIGQRVKALRMSNKAVTITGTIDALNDDGQTLVVKQDDSEALETVHVDDVMVLPEGETKDASSETKAAANETKSLTTVNGKAI